MKFFCWILSIGAFFVLGAAAVWMGGLNMDEGLYLYTANLVAEGKTLYRDFFFTQGPMLPYAYSTLTVIWKTWGLLGARIFTLTLGAAGILFAMTLARRLVPDEKKGMVSLIVLLLLGCNLYHLYYVAIPKTYALAGLFVIVGFWFLAVARTSTLLSVLAMAAAGLSLAFAAGTRISLGALLAVVGFHLLLSRKWISLAAFCIGGFTGLALVYLPFLFDESARAGLIAAQRYHTARGGFDLVWTVGSFSRLVRWYLPVFVILGLGVRGVGTRCRCTEDGENSTVDLRPTPNLLLFSFLAVFVVQMLAPFPYEDYQVPVMSLLAVYAAVTLVSTSTFNLNLSSLLVLGLCFANSFGSPLLEKWMTNGQDRFWSLKKEKCELQQLRDVAKRIEQLDPGGTMLLTQDLYLAIETNRKVPQGLELGPFSILSDAEWKRLLTVTAPIDCRVAALSGYSFAIEPPVCKERSLETQMEYWSLLKRNYELSEREEFFGQNATSLLILKRK